MPPAVRTRHSSARQLDEAERYAHRAREIKEALDLSVEPWKTYNILAEIAEKRGLAEEAQVWRQKAQATYQAFVERSGGQADPAVAQWLPVIRDIVTVCNGDAGPLAELDPFLDRMQAQDDWQALIPVIRRIIAGERDSSLADGLDFTDTAIVRRILQALDDPSTLASPAPAEQGDTGDIEAEQGQAGDDGLGQLITLVVAGAGGNQQAAQQARMILEPMQSSELPSEVRQLGTALLRVLDGSRGEQATAGLPDQLAQLVQVVLQSL